MSFDHPLGIEEIGYFVLNETTVGWTWRAGCTSVIASMEPYYDIVVSLTHPPKQCHLFLKNPIERVRSAWVAQPFVDGGPPPARISMEEFIDGILDDVPGVRSPHSNPQLWQHRKVKDITPWRLEGSTHICGVPLLHKNVTEDEKPPVNYRVPELLDYYAQDIQAWEAAVPCELR